MKLTETQIAMEATESVDRKDPDAIRARFVGTPPGTHDPKHPENKPTGELMPGEYGYARPVNKAHPNYLWLFTSDRGFSMVCPPHDIRKKPSEERYPKIRPMERTGLGFGPKKAGEDVPGWEMKGSLDELI